MSMLFFLTLFVAIFEILQEYVMFLDLINIIFIAGIGLAMYKACCLDYHKAHIYSK